MAVGLGLVLSLGTAHAGPPAGSATAAGSAASPTALDSKMPVSWTAAVPLALARPNDRCKAVRLGEWARVTCSPNGFISDAFLLGGSHQGVAFREARAEGGIHAIFPMRPGDRRELVVNHLIGRGGYTVEEGAAVVISETWLAGESEATIAIAMYP